HSQLQKGLWRNIRSKSGAASASGRSDEPGHSDTPGRKQNCDQNLYSASPTRPSGSNGSRPVQVTAASSDCAAKMEEQQEANQEVKLRQGTRVFKKSSPNGKITAYLGRRDFIDHLTHVDPIDGVVLVDPEYVKDRKVFVHVLAAFRYGREDLDVLGLTFRKDLYHSSRQIFPPPAEDASAAERKLTRLQERLVKKLGEHAYPFCFDLPAQQSPASVTLQPGPNDSGKPCGVDYELKAYVADSEDGKSHKRSTVKLAIRKLTYAPAEPGPQPSADTTKAFMMSSGCLRLEASLDKEQYYHGESIAINVLVDNNSHRSVKRVRITVSQVADICLFSPNSYKCAVAELESDEGFPIGPSQTGWCKVYRVCPLLSNNRDKRGLALDGQLKHEDTSLASSTIAASVSSSCRETQQQGRESLGIVVSYRVKVRLVLGFGASDVSVELPFILTHPKPPDADSLAADETQPAASTAIASAPTAGCNETATEPAAAAANAVDPDLIHLDTAEHSNPPDDDLIFEDFARLRLQGCGGGAHTDDEA
uniref:Arrestin_C domain-containing protein n=2 Tax=Macrostomum lignano TaxID=282301 RepID=A0A1I8FXN5_9PLAT